jgi:hypothetical protein
VNSKQWSALVMALIKLSKKQSHFKQTKNKQKKCFRQTLLEISNIPETPFWFHAILPVCKVSTCPACSKKPKGGIRGKIFEIKHAYHKSPPPPGSGDM